MEWSESLLGANPKNLSPVHIQQLFYKQGGRCAISGQSFAPDSRRQCVTDEWAGRHCLVCSWIYAAGSGDYDSLLPVLQNYYELAAANFVVVDEPPDVEHALTPVMIYLANWLATTYRFDHSYIHRDSEMIEFTTGGRYGDEDWAIHLNLERSAIEIWDKEKHDQDYADRPYDFECSLGDPNMLAKIQDFFLGQRVPTRFPGARYKLQLLRYESI